MWVLFQAIRIYWRTLFNIFWPIVILPVFLIHNSPEFRTIYVLLLMIGYWVTESIPLSATSLIPMVLFPLMGVLDAATVAQCYLRDTITMFLAGLMFAVAIEYSDLHKRIAFLVIICVGCSVRRINFGLIIVTAFLSAWISNTAAVAMMIPIIRAVLRELEVLGFGNVYTNEGEIDPDTEKPFTSDKLKPSNVTTCFYLSVAYAASMGGMGSIIGTPPNLSLKGIYDKEFPNAPGKYRIEFANWLIICFPVAAVSSLALWVFMQIWFLGMFRPRSEISQQIKMSPESVVNIKQMIKKQQEEMGKTTFQQGAILFLFFVAILLWFFRKPYFIPGWAELITRSKTWDVSDATAGLMVVIFVFMIPANLSFFKAFSKDPEQRPKEAAPGLCTWEALQEGLPWGVLILIGSGFTLSEASKQSGMNKLIGDQLSGLKGTNQFALLVVGCLFGSIVSEFSSNTATANVLLPIIATLSRVARTNPLILMYPSTLSCSHAFCFPVGTPPNAIVQDAGNISTWSMMKTGLLVNIFAFVILIGIFPWLVMAYYGLFSYTYVEEDWM